MKRNERSMNYSEIWCSNYLNYVSTGSAGFFNPTS